MTEGWLYSVDTCGETPLQRASRSGHMSLAELMLRQEIEDYTQIEIEGETTPLHEAAFLGMDQAVSVLLKQGYDPDDIDMQGETPLHKAARQGHVESVRVLLEWGADANVRNVYGFTPLHWVAVTGRDDLAVLMMRYAADPRLADEQMDGLTPLAIARFMGYKDLVSLFERGWIEA